MSKWKKVRGNNVVARRKSGEGLILVADEKLASSGFYILLEPATGVGRWFFLCGHKTEMVSIFVSDDELVEVTFGNTRIRANPSKGWVHLLRK